MLSGETYSKLAVASSDITVLLGRKTDFNLGCLDSPNQNSITFMFYVLNQFEIDGSAIVK